MTRPLVIAHRGASTFAPENTLAAFQLAIDAGAEGVEFDVRVAKDGVPVVIHDDDLRRTGLRPERVADLTSGELANVDIGSWFNTKYPALANSKFARQTVPALTDALDLLKDFNGLIYIELKCDEWNCVDLVTAVCEVIRGSPQLPQMIVKSFKLGAIPKIRHNLPSAATAALFGSEIMHYLRRREYLIALAREFGADQISVHHSLITPRLSRLGAETNMPLTVWTVDDPVWVMRRRNLDIGAVITNDPAKMLAAF
jgi:glycerophosphoryl diester phosphodiesterase